MKSSDAARGLGNLPEIRVFHLALSTAGCAAYSLYALYEAKMRDIMTDKRWKARERATARLLGTKRLPSNGHAQADIHATVGGYTLAVEHKSRESLPAWLTEAMAQSVRNAPAGSLPVVAITAGAGPGKPCHRLAMVRLVDLPALLESVRNCVHDAQAVESTL
jgi:hypothetical protein